MNLSPDWVLVLLEHGFDAVHWSSLGAANAPDSEIIGYAFQHRCVAAHRQATDSLPRHRRKSQNTKSCFGISNESGFKFNSAA